MDDPGPPASLCRNCGNALFGRYCTHCGQTADVHVPSTRELIHEALEGLTHSDSRLWRTLARLWFEPGRLTCEFVAGRRASYLPPFRLYLIMSVICFLLVSVARNDVQQAHAVFEEPAKDAASRCVDVNFMTFAEHPQWNTRIERACQGIVRDNGASLVHVALATMPKAMFIFLPLVAFLHMLMYWRPRHRYAEQLLFFLHLHAFYFSIAASILFTIAAQRWWPSSARVLGHLDTVLYSLMPLYTVLAMRRVFRRGWASTLFKALALFVIYDVVLAITVAGVVLYAALQL